MKVQMTFLIGVFAMPCLGMDMNAYKYGAEANIVYQVVDDAGMPVSNALVHVWFRSDYPKLDVRDWVSSTDANGEFVAESITNERLSVGIDKEGYYHTFDRVCFRSNENKYKVVNGKWQPYGETRMVVLKKIRKPGALCVPACRVRVESTVPTYGEWLPFDLEKFDWVTPRGKGAHADVLLRFKRRITEKWNDFKYEMEVSFTNNPFAGVVEMKKDCNSDLTTIYNADPNAVFTPTFRYYLERTPGGGSKSVILDGNSYLIFRTRTTVDSEGKLKTAHYGTIHGGWMPGKSNMTLSDGCFNPTPNDTNIEDGRQLREMIKNKWR